MHYAHVWWCSNPGGMLVIRRGFCKWCNTIGEKLIGNLLVFHSYNHSKVGNDSHIGYFLQHLGARNGRELCAHIDVKASNILQEDFSKFVLRNHNVCHAFIMSLGNILFWYVPYLPFLFRFGIHLIWCGPLFIIDPCILSCNQCVRTGEGGMGQLLATWEGHIRLIIQVILVLREFGSCKWDLRLRMNLFESKGALKTSTCRLLTLNHGPSLTLIYPSNFKSMTSIQPKWRKVMAP